MYEELKGFLYQAEQSYLQTEDLNKLRQCSKAVKERLEVYQIIRDQEVNIFQTLADEMLETFPQQKTKVIEEMVVSWALVMRYCSMAMLLNNPEFLDHRLLEWLTPVKQVHQRESMEASLHQSLDNKLQKLLSKEQYQLIAVYLEQAKATLIGEKNTVALSVGGEY